MTALLLSLTLLSQDDWFADADADGSGFLDRTEMDAYLDGWLEDPELPKAEIFRRLDADDEGLLTREEFAPHEDLITELMGADYLTGPEPPDPGVDFVPFAGPASPVDDAAVDGAVYHRHFGLVRTGGAFAAWPTEAGTAATGVAVPSGPPAAGAAAMARATAIIAGSNGDEYYTAGAVLISADGLAVTNYHVVDVGEGGKLTGMLADGQCLRVSEILAVDESRDVALIRLAGSRLPHVGLAEKTPPTGADLQLLHHSESRFYAYDRGHVVRHVRIGGRPWMEVTTDYSTGGSGCGIFDAEGRLVGLAAAVASGDGPSLSPGGYAEEPEAGVVTDYAADYGDPLTTMKVRHAVPLPAIRGLFGGP